MLFSEPKIPQFRPRVERLRGRVSVSVLFSEPKIPQFTTRLRLRLARHSFSALQRAENSSIPPTRSCAPSVRRFQCSSASRKFLNQRQRERLRARNDMFQCSSASRKFLNCSRHHRQTRALIVSVLFSEPKIPQSTCVICASDRPRSFSALQRAENSSIPAKLETVLRIVVCFSALQRAENSSIVVYVARRSSAARCFSALQRAENSSMREYQLTLETKPRFQCSSASRKFLNPTLPRAAAGGVGSFQCSSASRKFLNVARVRSGRRRRGVSVLFSEPKIPQCRRAGARGSGRDVSVLFSEPKIPQSITTISIMINIDGFQCSSASRKFLNR